MVLYKKKYSIFISSTYEDLRDERQAAMGVALENNFIPVGMEQFHAAPVGQWTVITRMIDDCDSYLLIIGGRYGTIDPETNISYTEKEYGYAKGKGIPVIAIIEKQDGITKEKMDRDDWKSKQEKLEAFIHRVENDNNTVDYFDGIDDLKYKISVSLKNLEEDFKETAGWVRYEDIVSIVNSQLQSANQERSSLNVYQTQIIDNMNNALLQFTDRLKELEDNQLSYREISEITKEDIKKLFE